MDEENVLKGGSPRSNRFAPLQNSESFDPPMPDPFDTDALNGSMTIGEQKASYVAGPPTLIITGKVNADGSLDMRTDTVVRDEPKANGNPGKLNIRRTKARAKKMINRGEGRSLPSLADKRRNKKSATRR